VKRYKRGNQKPGDGVVGVQTWEGVDKKTFFEPRRVRGASGGENEKRGGERWVRFVWGAQRPGKGLGARWLVRKGQLFGRKDQSERVVNQVGGGGRS